MSMMSMASYVVVYGKPLTLGPGLPSTPLDDYTIAFDVSALLAFQDPCILGGV